MTLPSHRASPAQWLRFAVLTGAGTLSVTIGGNSAEARADASFSATPGAVEIPFVARQQATDPDLGGLYTKSRALLGGTPSQLDLIMSLQNSPAAPSFASMATPIALPLSFTVNGGSKAALEDHAIGAVPDAGFVDRSSLSAGMTGGAGKRTPTALSGLASIPGSTDTPDVFGSVGILVRHTALDSKWRSVANASLGRGPWSGLIEAASTMMSIDQVATVNHWVNARIHFTSDSANGATSDDWAGAARSLRSGRGDCEDYAIAKMQILHRIGFSENDLYLVIARDLVRRADHAVLAVRVEGKLVILDSETDALLDGAAAQDYRPLFSYSGTRSWIHGYRREGTTPILASQAVPRAIQVASR